MMFSLYSGPLVGVDAGVAPSRPPSSTASAASVSLEPVAGVPRTGDAGGRAGVTAAGPAGVGAVPTR